jgi:hypothetical protein
MHLSVAPFIRAKAALQRVDVAWVMFSAERREYWLENLQDACCSCVANANHCVRKGNTVLAQRRYTIKLDGWLWIN